MGRVLAGITISVDGFITGPGDGPGCGLGVGGERLHYWVFGGPWSYDTPGRGEPAGQDKAWLGETMAANGAVIAGRGTYEAAGHWGGQNPWGIPFFIVTHRPEQQPPGGGFIFTGSLAEAIDQARAAAGGKQVHVMGGAAGRFDWGAPDEEVLRFVNDLERPVSTYLYGRRMYERMLYWETAHTAPGQPSSVREFTGIWQAATQLLMRPEAAWERPS